MRALMLVAGVSAVQFNGLLFRSKNKTQKKSMKKMWEPSIEKEKDVTGLEVKKQEGACRCPMGQFWYELAGEHGTGECVGQYDLQDECGFYPADVRPRVCKAGLVCTRTDKQMEKEDIKDDYTEHTLGFGKPAKCLECEGEDCLEGEAAHKKNCAKTVTVSGQVCYKLKIEKANCGEGGKEVSADASAEAEATATATATATAEVPGSVEVKATVDGNTATVKVPIEDKKVEVTKEVTTTATADASGTASTEDVAKVNGKADVEACVTVEEAFEEMGVPEDKREVLTVKQGSKFEKEIERIAYAKALDKGLGEASDDACVQAHEIAMAKAKAMAEKAAQDAAADAANDAAQAAADGAAADAAGAAAENEAAKDALTPEQYAAAKEEAEHLAGKATAGAQDLAGGQAEGTAATVADGHAAPTPGDAPAEAGPGVKQTEGDVAATQP